MTNFQRRIILFVSAACHEEVRGCDVHNNILHISLRLPGLANLFSYRLIYNKNIWFRGNVRYFFRKYVGQIASENVKTR